MLRLANISEAADLPLNADSSALVKNMLVVCDRVLKELLRNSGRDKNSKNDISTVKEMIEYFNSAKTHNKANYIYLAAHSFMYSWQYEKDKSLYELFVSISKNRKLIDRFRKYAGNA